MEEEKIDYSKQGKKNRAAGGKFERIVRKDMESQGWILDKWTNNVDLIEKKIIPAKRKFNPFLKILGIGTGFPDFIGIKMEKSKKKEIIGVEVKKNGYLSQEEKAKCRFYLELGLFSKILIAKAIKKERKLNIEYIDFIEKYGE